MARRSKRRLRRPTTPIRKSSPSAPICAPSMKACRKRWPAGGRPSRSTARSAPSVPRTRRPATANAPAHQTLQPHTYSLTVNQPLFNGGNTVARTAQAEDHVQSERAKLIATESTALFTAAQVLFRCAARSRRGRARPQQREGAVAPARDHDRSVPRRPGDAHRRGASAIGARRRDRDASDRSGHARERPRELYARRRPCRRSIWCSRNRAWRGRRRASRRWLWLRPRIPM